MTGLDGNAHRVATRLVEEFCIGLRMNRSYGSEPDGARREMFGEAVAGQAHVVEAMTGVVAALGWDLNGLGVRLSLRALTRRFDPLQAGTMDRNEMNVVVNELVEEWTENVRGE